MKQETTFKDFMEDFYKKPFNQIPKKELNEHYRELFGMGLSKDCFATEPITLIAVFHIKPPR